VNNCKLEFSLEIRLIELGKNIVAKKNLCLGIEILRVIGRINVRMESTAIILILIHKVDDNPILLIRLENMS